MGLKEGTLESLVDSGADASAIANTVFPQMLQALDCIAWEGIIHRDLKPENILYISHPGGQYQFQLGDFGLCNRVVDATTFAGSRLYMAPEMFGKEAQTCKLDVWSLFVTMLWVLDIEGFRQTEKADEFKSIGEAQEAVLHAAANVDTILRIREMAVVNPEGRASAAQMLIKCFNGEGLSTPRNQVPALPISPSPAIAPARVSARAPPTLTTRNTQTKPRDLQKNTNIFAAAAQYRIEKARDSLQPQPLRRLPGLRQKPQAKS
jgi:serine/threonine protein kinase